MGSPSGLPLVVDHAWPDLKLTLLHGCLGRFRLILIPLIFLLGFGIPFALIP